MIYFSRITSTSLFQTLTQEETVAKMQLLGVEISRGSYAQLECGLYNIKVSELLALAQIFNVSINEFFDGMEL